MYCVLTPLACWCYEQAIMLTERRSLQSADATGGSVGDAVSRIYDRLGVHAVLAVPLLRETEVLGALVLRRNSPVQFAHETVQLLQTLRGSRPRHAGKVGWRSLPR